jgi:hypothetical protein
METLHEMGTGASDSENNELASMQLIKRIRKLRWMGMEDEASRAETLLGEFPPHARGVIVVGERHTD